MDDHRIAQLEVQVRRLRTQSLVGILAGMGIGGVAVFLAVRSPGSLRVGRVVIDGDKVEIVANDHSKGAKLDDDGLYVQDPKGVASLHGHELWMAGREHKLDMWLDETPKGGHYEGQLVFSMQAGNDAGYTTSVHDTNVHSMWSDGRGHRLHLDSDNNAEIAMHADPPATWSAPPAPPTPKGAASMPF